MKWLPHSIRWRIQAWHGLLLLLVLAGLGITAHRLQRFDSLRRLDSELQLRLAALNVALDRNQDGGPDQPDGPPPEALLGGLDFPEGGHGPPSKRMRLPAEFERLFAPEGGYYYSLWKRSGEPLDSSSNAPRDNVRPLRTQQAPGERTRAGMRENFSFTPPGECLLVGVSEAGVNDEMLRFDGWLAAVGGVVMALGLIGGWYLASTAIAPIHRISTAAARLADGHFDERIVVEETDSELGRLAALLNDTFARLDHAFSEQARFTSDAAHELRTPVAVILAQCQLALSRARSPEGDLKALQITRRAAERMQNLIESLLTLAQLDARPDSEAQPPCDLAELGRENLEQIRPLAEERSIHLRGELAPIVCHTSADGINQIVTNLLSNAVKYSRPGDNVCLATCQEGDHVVVSVSDTGPGIEPQHLPHLFDRFYRADASRNRSTGGAGLGLAICKSIAESLGGWLEVRSAPGEGSTFTLRLQRSPGLEMEVPGLVTEAWRFKS